MHAQYSDCSERLMPTNAFDSYRGLISDGRVSYHIDPSPEHGPGHHKLYIEPDDPVQRRGMSLSCLWLLTPHHQTLTVAQTVKVDNTIVTSLFMVAGLYHNKTYSPC